MWEPEGTCWGWRRGVTLPRSCCEMSLEKTSCRSGWFSALPTFHSGCRSCWRSFSKLKLEEAIALASFFFARLHDGESMESNPRFRDSGDRVPDHPGTARRSVIAETYRRCI